MAGNAIEIRNEKDEDIEVSEGTLTPGESRTVDYDKGIFYTEDDQIDLFQGLLTITAQDYSVEVNLKTHVMKIYAR